MKTKTTGAFLRLDHFSPNTDMECTRVLSQRSPRLSLAAEAVQDGRLRVFGIISLPHSPHGPVFGPWRPLFRDGWTSVLTSARAVLGLISGRSAVVSENLSSREAR